MKKSKIQIAKMLARQAHKDQKYGGFPYIFHLQNVVKVAVDNGLSEEIICACWLHDTIEDTPTTYNDIKKVLGIHIAETVFAVTDELGRNRKERKQKTYPKIKSNSDAVAVKLCDRIANISYCINEGDNELLKMYVKEHGEFKAVIYISGVYDNLWAELDSWISTAKRRLVPAISD